MPPITDTDRNVFENAANNPLDNFTASELADIRRLGQRLKAILRAALNRHIDEGASVVNGHAAETARPNHPEK